MKESAMYARYNEAGNKVVRGLLDKLGGGEREKDRGSFYGSLSGLFRHVFGGTRYFLGLFRETLAGNAAARAAIAAIDGVPMPPEGALDDAGWREFCAALEKVDAAYIAVAEAVREEDLALPVKVEWYGGNPAAVPLGFMLSQLLVHNTHHRGQISQILDSLKVENDFSGIGIDLLPK